MTYTTQSQLIDRIGEPMLVALTDNRSDAATGGVVTAVLDRALADTDAMIDGYLAARYQLPLSAVPAMVADIAVAIALWKLHISSPEDKVKADYDAALRTLRDIAQGIVRIPDAAGIEPTSSGASGVVATDRARPFTEETMKGYI